MIQFPLLESAADFELTPLYTSCEYAGPETSYLPILTVRFAYCAGTGLTVRIDSFEEHPVIDPDVMTNGHCVSAAFDLGQGEGSHVLQFLADASGRCRFFRDGREEDGFPCAMSSGEEERGFYWSVSAVLPDSLLEEVYGTAEPASVRGNVFKMKLAGPGRHLGAIAPLSCPEDILSPANLVPMEIIRL